MYAFRCTEHPKSREIRQEQKSERYISGLQEESHTVQCKSNTQRGAKRTQTHTEERNKLALTEKEAKLTQLSLPYSLHCQQLPGKPVRDGIHLEHFNRAKISLKQNGMTDLSETALSNNLHHLEVRLINLMKVEGVFLGTVGHEGSM